MKVISRFYVSIHSSKFSNPYKAVLGRSGQQIRNAWKVLKCGAGEGWRRSVRPIMLEVKKCYLESMNRGMSYMK